MGSPNTGVQDNKARKPPHLSTLVFNCKILFFLILKYFSMNSQLPSLPIP